MAVGSGKPVSGAGLRGDALAAYLQDHHAAGEAGSRLAQRIAAKGTPELRRVAGEIQEDLRALEDLMARLGVRRHGGKDLVARVGERLSRLASSARGGRSRAGLRDVLELETLSVGITGKRALWETLRVSSDLPRDEIESLLERAERQWSAVEHARLLAATAAFADAPPRDAADRPEGS